MHPFIRFIIAALVVVPAVWFANMWMPYSVTQEPIEMPDEMTEASENVENEAGAMKLDPPAMTPKHVPQTHFAVEPPVLDGDAAFIHVSSEQQPDAAHYIKHFVEEVVPQLKELKENPALASKKTVVFYQTVKTGADQSKNLYTYTFDFAAMNQADLSNKSAYELLSFLKAPTGPKVGKDYSQLGQSATEAFCGMAKEGSENSSFQMASRSMLCQ